MEYERIPTSIRYDHEPRSSQKRMDHNRLRTDGKLQNQIMFNTVEIRGAIPILNHYLLRLC